MTGQLSTPEHPGSMAPVAQQIASLRSAGVDVDVVEIGGAGKRKYLRAIPALRRRLAAADLIHAHFGYCGWVARCQAQRAVVVSFMGDDLLGTIDAGGRLTRRSRLVVQLNRLVARTLDAVIVKSAEMARILAPVSAHVIPNGVDLHQFSAFDTAGAQAALGWQLRTRYVLFPGNPRNPGKGFELCQRALRAAASRVSEPIELVVLWGVPHDQVPLYMHASDAMILGSFTEGSPNVVKEAMACNLPVVSVPVGDVPELLAGVSSCAICPRDPQQLGAALADILERRQRSDGRLALLRHGLDQPSVARRVIAVYDSVLRRQRDGL